MDPNATLTALIELAGKVTGQYDRYQPIDPHAASTLAELATALNEWMSKGGALPEAWQANR